MPDTLFDGDAMVPQALRHELMQCAIKTGISYQWLCGIYVQGFNAKLGATGSFPYGKTQPDDEGELVIAIAADPRQGVVRLEFGKPVGWLALPSQHAKQLAAMLLEKAQAVEKGKA